ncbi:MAG: GNAT family N-acetyltransferase, partial [Pirellula sp.]
YLTGMNPEFADSKPGWQLLYGCIRHAISLQCDSIDFLRGDEEYKGRLGAIPSMQQRWVVPSRRWLSKLRVATYLAASEVKSWWQSPTIATATASANASATTAANSVELT